MRYKKAKNKKKKYRNPVLNKKALKPKEDKNPHVQPSSFRTPKDTQKAKKGTHHSFSKNNHKYKKEAGRIDFLGKSKYFTSLSFVLTLASLICIFLKSFNYGIDFAGGTEIQIQFTEFVKTEDLRDFIKNVENKDLKGKNYTIQSFGEENEFLLRIESLDKKTAKENAKEEDSVSIRTQSMIDSILNGMKSQFKESSPIIRRVDSVGPQIGSELKRNGVLALFYSLLIILIYIGLRFDYKYAPGAVFCLFHDAIITLGIFSFFNLEINIQTMAAILTIIGYSLNDTIVNFDRVRENVQIFRNLDFKVIVNRSINEVLSRTLLTSITTLIALGTMYFISGGVIRDFAFTLGIGVVIGTYSSIYVASPLVIFVDRWQKTHQKSVSHG